MSETATYRFDLTGLDCANCAASLEGKIAKLDGISNVTVNFMKNSLTYDCDHEAGKSMESRVRELIAREEPEAVLTSKGHSHHHEHEHACEEHHHEEHCSCEHHHEEEETATYRFDLTGLDCANCAASLEGKIAELEGISNVSVNFMKSTLTYDCDHDEGAQMEARVRELIAREEPEAVLTSKGHSHHHEHHHHHHEESDPMDGMPEYKLRIEQIDCADCAAHLEHKIKEIPGISNVSLNFMTSTLTYDCDDPEKMEQMIRELVAKEEPDAIVSSYEAGKPEDLEEDQEQTMLIRLIVGAVLFVIGLFTSGTVQIVLEIAAYLVLGYDVLLKAVKGIGRGQLFDEHFLMSVATLAAMYLKDFREAAGVMLFYQIGEYFQDRAVASSRKSIGELMDIRPDYATVKTADSWKKVNPQDVVIGNLIRVIPGERIPLDGIIRSGASSLDTSSLTGESRLRDVEAGDEVISGSVNETGVLEIEVTKCYGDSTVARILDLVENQDSHKANAENFITKFSRVYTPAVVAAAVIVAVVVSFITKDINIGIYRACTFLVISCPCALVISVPLSFFAGIGGLSRKGILVKGANIIEPLSKTHTVVMDKTGTLTQGVFKVSEIRNSSDEAETLEDAAYAEANSTHPIAAGIRNAYGTEPDSAKLADVKEIAGRGTCVKRGEDVILAGNYKLMQDNGIACDEIKADGTSVYVAKNGRFEGCILLEDQLKEDAGTAVERLKKKGVAAAIVSGDSQSIVEKAGQMLGICEIHGGCMPEDKVRIVKEYRERGITVFVGDGVNDAPVLAAADIGMAMGALGSDAAIEAADVVIMDDKLNGVAMAIDASKRILRIVNVNIYGAIAVKILTLILGAFGVANMWWAIFADTGVAMLCVLNAMRLLRMKEG